MLHRPVQARSWTYYLSGNTVNLTARPCTNCVIEALQDGFPANLTLCRSSLIVTIASLWRTMHPHRRGEFSSAEPVATISQGMSWKQIPDPRSAKDARKRHSAWVKELKHATAHTSSTAWLSRIKSLGTCRPCVHYAASPTGKAKEQVLRLQAS